MLGFSQNEALTGLLCWHAFCIVLMGATMDVLKVKILYY